MGGEQSKIIVESKGNRINIYHIAITLDWLATMIILLDIQFSSSSKLVSTYPRMQHTCSVHLCLLYSLPTSDNYDHRPAGGQIPGHLGRSVSTIQTVSITILLQTWLRARTWWNRVKVRAHATRLTRSRYESDRDDEGRDTSARSCR